MNEELKQPISELFDNELEHTTALNLLTKIQDNAELKQVFTRYAIISHALKNNEVLPIANDFSEKIAAQIDKEVFYLNPPRQTSKRYGTLLALAASIAAIAVIIPLKLSQQITTPTTIARQSDSQNVIQTTPILASSKKNQRENGSPLNARIIDYLQAHNNTIYGSDQVDYKPLAAVTAYTGAK